MNFVEESGPQQEVPSAQEDQPVNVGVRLKKLKTSDSDNPEVSAEPLAPMPMEHPVEIMSEEPSPVPTG